MIIENSELRISSLYFDSFFSLSIDSFIIVASGTSGRHIQSIADKVIENLKTKKIKILGTEGMETKDWILIDAGEVIINIMSEDSREHYDLESLWDRKTK